MLIYKEFLKELDKSKEVTDLLQYLADNWLVLMGSNYLDNMSDAFSNRYRYCDYMLEDILGKIAIAGIDYVRSRLEVD